jgi:hypothetical protein
MVTAQQAGFWTAMVPKHWRIADSGANNGN